MSDLFIGEILVLFLLLPVLIRPFLRRLQRVEGIPLLPFLAFLLCLAIIAGMGLRITFLPLFAFTVLVFVSGLIRLFRLFRHLPTDWYSPVSVAYNSFLLVVFVGVFFTSFLFAPETGYISKGRVQRTLVLQTDSPYVRARYRVWSPEKSPNANPTVLFLGDISSSADGRNTTALLLAESGYTVIAADYTCRRDYANLLLFVPSLRQFSVQFGKIFSKCPKLTTDEEIFAAQSAELSRMIAYARKTRGDSVPLFGIAEGSGCSALLACISSNPGTFNGGVCIVSPGKTSGLPAITDGLVVLDSADKMMPANAGSSKVLELTGKEPALYGSGEISCDDVLAAVLLGGTRDADRKNAELTGRRIVTWFSLRRAYDHL